MLSQSSIVNVSSMRLFTYIRPGVWLLAVVWFFAAIPLTYAQQSSSPSYQVNEVQFGSGGSVDSSSTNYKSQTSVGSLGGGRSSSANFSADSGFLTQNEPYLEMGVINASVDLGDLTPTATHSGAGSFYVRSYTSGGYSIINLGTPPVNASNNQLKAKTTLGAPIIGTEEFGMNLVKNVNFCGSGCNLGDNPVPVPDNTFATGVAATGYSTAGQFKFGVGDTIASAPNGDGQTNFTVSFIANINSVTPAGSYTTQADFAVIASY